MSYKIGANHERNVERRRARPRVEWATYKPIECARCHRARGTLINIGGRYFHPQCRERG